MSGLVEATLNSDRVTLFSVGMNGVIRDQCYHVLDCGLVFSALGWIRDQGALLHRRTLFASLALAFSDDLGFLAITNGDGGVACRAATLDIEVELTHVVVSEELRPKVRIAIHIHPSIQYIYSQYQCLARQLHRQRTSGEHCLRFDRVLPSSWISPRLRLTV